MSFHLVKRLMFVLAALAILGGAMIPAGHAVAAPAGIDRASNCDDCPAMQMHLPCSSAKAGHCTMGASDCARMMACYDTQPGAMAQPAAEAVRFAFTPISYHDDSAALLGHPAEPALFPPKQA